MWFWGWRGSDVAAKISFFNHRSSAIETVADSLEENVCIPRPNSGTREPSYKHFITCLQKLILPAPRGGSKDENHRPKPAY